MEFRLLGPLAVADEGQPFPIAAGAQRIILAALLLNANHVVTSGKLTDYLWPSAPPLSARACLHNSVMRLRQALGPAASRIGTNAAGYAISADASEIDVDRFERLIETGRSAARRLDWAAANSQLRAALALWRGRPLADIPSEQLTRGERQRLAGMRLDAAETLAEAGIASGDHSTVIAQLTRLTHEEPLREQLHVLLMIAHYQSGQRAAALAAYHNARRALLDAGLDPGPALQDAQKRMLSDAWPSDRQRAWPRPARAGAVIAVQKTGPC
jgi:DNA-binding SARP family transcriptional activator